MIRPATAQDLASIATLYRRVWHETHGPHMPRAEQDARDERFFLDRMTRLMPNVVVCEADRVIVGFAAWNGSRLGQLFVDAAARGSGVAEGLMGAAEDGLRAQNVGEAELRCLVGNGRARRFYQRVGWQVRDSVTETVRGDEGDEGDDRREFWVMRKRLVAR